MPSLILNFKKEEYEKLSNFFKRFDINKDMLAKAIPMYLSACIENKLSMNDTSLKLVEEFSKIHRINLNESLNQLIKSGFEREEYHVTE